MPLTSLDFVNRNDQQLIVFNKTNYHSDQRLSTVEDRIANTLKFATSHDKITFAAVSDVKTKGGVRDL